MSTEPATPRKRPCASCPYRRDAPSGLWAEHEYDKLPLYDGTVQEQAEAGAFAPFHCHTNEDTLCAGWVGTHDMANNLAVRLGVPRGRIDLDSVLDYESPVPLFASGAEAAEHGKRDIASPDERARRKAHYLERRIARREERTRDDQRDGQSRAEHSRGHDRKVPQSP